jgi:hypothetical protein
MLLTTALVAIATLDSTPELRAQAGYLQTSPAGSSPERVN